MGDLGNFICFRFRFQGLGHIEYPQGLVLALNLGCNPIHGPMKWDHEGYRSCN